MPTYTIGVDFGTESGRALLVDCSSGAEIASAVHYYEHGVIDTLLPDSAVSLPFDWALQDPEDYIAVLQTAVPEALRKSGVHPQDVVGIGIDFTSCTMLPTTKDGRPLCSLPVYRKRPHAWVKLWKHHAAQAQADRINAVGAARNELWAPRYGGRYSSEWFFSKALQILEEDPEVYSASERLIEAADWLVWQLTGVETRNICTAGYKAMYHDGDFPSEDFFAELNPAFRDVIETRVRGPLVELGAKAGELTRQAAEWMGLSAGIAVAAANVDAHVTPPAVKITEPGHMVMIMGTSTCDILLGTQLREVDGMCGAVLNGVVPGAWGYEAGQNGVGDIFAWFVENATPAKYFHAAAAEGLDIHAYLEREAAKLAPGESGLLALDWWLGNRSVLVDVDLTGMILGLTKASTAPEIYRALLEATAFGARRIIEAFEERGIAVKDIVAAGGLPEKNKLLRSIYADVIGKDLYLSGSPQAPALGAAIHAAVAAGVYTSVTEAANVMGKLQDEAVRPNPQHTAIYDQLYSDYLILHDYFGRGGNDVMKRLKKLRNARGGE